MTEFKLSANDLKPKSAFENPFWMPSFAEPKVVRRGLLLVRVKTVIGYFAMSSSMEASTPRPMGFRPPKKETPSDDSGH